MLNRFVDLVFALSPARTERLENLSLGDAETVDSVQITEIIVPPKKPDRSAVLKRPIPSTMTESDYDDAVELFLDWCMHHDHCGMTAVPRIEQLVDRFNNGAHPLPLKSEPFFRALNRAGIKRSKPRHAESKSGRIAVYHLPMDEHEPRIAMAA